MLHENMMVYGGKCRETGECFLVPVEERNSCLRRDPVIKQHILPRKRIISDMWKAYDCLQDEGYVHLKVNHSLNFVDPDTGALHKKSRAHVGSKTKFTPYKTIERSQRQFNI